MRALAAMLVLAGCGLAAPERGELRSPGVARATFEVRSGSTDLVAVDVVFPADAEGRPAVRGAPGVVFLQGGGVSADRYLWQADALARAGFVVALPRHWLGLAILDVEAGEAAASLLRAPPVGSALDGLTSGPLAVAGHSLGGVIALKLLPRGTFQAVVAQAAYPDPPDEPALAVLDVPSMFLAGAGDCQAKEAQVRDGWQVMPSPTAVVVLPGVTHYGFTDALTEDIARRCPTERPLEEMHEAITAAMVAFLGPALSTGTVDGDALRAVPGAQVEVR